MSIITGRGDSGETDLMFGRRAPKTSLRIEALGSIDELNAALGVVRASVSAGFQGDGQGLIARVDRIQSLLVGLMGQLACIPEDVERYLEKGYSAVRPEDLEWIVGTAKEIEAGGIRFTNWARPGEEGSVPRAALDFARTVARRAERQVLALHESGEPVSETIRLFFNRLSDLLWLLARGGNPTCDSTTSAPPA